ncbi:MAG: heparinase II/III domain-containing protein, partial [Planctomycetota bacterium]
AFDWSEGGGAQQYRIQIGTSQDSGNVYDVYINPPQTSFTAQSLPYNGNPLYVKLWTKLGDSWTGNYNYYSYPTSNTLVGWMQNPISFTNTMTQSEIETALGSWLTANIDNLCALISNDGSLDDDNIDMRDCANLFARLYTETSNYTHAEKAAKLLKEFAVHMPNWQCHHEYSDTSQTGEFPPYTIYKGGLWGRRSDEPFWSMAAIHCIAYDLSNSENGLPIAEAYYFIEDSGAMENLNALEDIREDVLQRHLDVQYHGGFTFANFAGAQVEGILIFEHLLNKNIPAAMHDVMWWLEALYKVRFYADGWWSEGTSGYYSQVHNNIRNESVLPYIQGYSDPLGYAGSVDGTCYVDLDLYSDTDLLSRSFSRADLLNTTAVQPNPASSSYEHFFCLADTTYPTTAWYSQKLTEAESILWGSMGHAVLGTGQANGSDINDLTQAHMEYGACVGHEHYDSLNLHIFAKGKEIMSETNYNAIAGDANASRKWNTATAAHCTVVVDEVNQPGRYGPNSIIRTQQPDDAIPGIPDWEGRWTGGGADSLQKGELKMFATDFDMVQVIEVDNQKAYGTRIDGQLLDRYRRMLALVKIDDHDSYVVDIFRVKGGSWHDYMLHGCLEEEYTVTFRNSSGSTLYPQTYWYDPICLNIHDTKYVNGQMNDVSVDFALNDGSAAIRSFLLKQQDTGNIFIGKAQAIRRVGDADFVGVRRIDTSNPLESVFVAVHHPYTGSPLVTGATAVPLDTTDAGAVALKVTLSTGRTDYIIHTITEPLVQIDTDDGSNISFVGKFAHVADGSSADDTWSYMVEGQQLVTDDMNIPGISSWSGTLTETRRVEAGDSDDAFITGTSLPTDGSLNGCTLMVDLGGVTSQAFEIDHVAVEGSDTVIHSKDEPGMTITPGLVKQEYYPCWGITGTAGFNILGAEAYYADQATNPDPADKSAGVEIDIGTLSWDAADGAISYNVYLGTDDTPDYQGNTSNLYYNNIGTLSEDQQYYWRVDTVLSGSVITGKLWSFTAGTSVAEMSSPSDRTNLTDSDVQFTWTLGSGVTQYRLNVGSTDGGGEHLNNYTTSNTSKLVTGLPVDGSTVYVSLESQVGGQWQPAEKSTCTALKQAPAGTHSYLTANSKIMVVHDTDDEWMYFNVPNNEVAYAMQIIKESDSKYYVVYHGEPNKPNAISGNRCGDGLKVAIDNGSFDYTMPSTRNHGLWCTYDITYGASRIYSSDDMSDYTNNRDWRTWGGPGNPMVVKGPSDSHYYVHFIAATDPDGDRAWSEADEGDCSHHLCLSRTTDFSSFDMRTELPSPNNICWREFGVHPEWGWDYPRALDDTTGAQLRALENYYMNDIKGMLGSVCYYDGKYYFFYADTDSSDNSYLYYRWTDDVDELVAATSWTSAIKVNTRQTLAGRKIMIAPAHDMDRWAVVYHAPQDTAEHYPDIQVQYTENMNVIGTGGLSDIVWYSYADRDNHYLGRQIGTLSVGATCYQAYFMTDPAGRLAVPDNKPQNATAGGLATFADHVDSYVGCWGGKMYLIYWDLYVPQATAPSPADDATGVSTSATLSWDAGYKATYYKVYFGTSSSPPYIDEQVETTYSPTLQSGQTYYWRIDAVNGDDASVTTFFR